MQSHPSLFATQEFISIFNDLYYYQNNYEDLDGMTETYMQYLNFYNSRFESFDEEIASHARRVLRKIEVLEKLNQDTPDQAEQILNAFIKEVHKPYLDDDLAYINSCYSNVTDYYYFNKEYPKAIKIAHQYLDFAKQSDSKFNIMLAYSKLATAFQQFGDFVNGLKNTEPLVHFRKENLYE